MNTKQQERITVIDALRGFTLFGILIVHVSYLWSFHDPVPVSNLINTSIKFFIDIFMRGKFYKVFNILFGVSFFIIISRAEAKGVDFRLRFVWRLVILIFIGWLHELIYTWEALLVYGLFGIPLVFFYKLDKKKVLVLAISCLAISPFYGITYQHLFSNSQSEEIVQIVDNERLNIEKNRNESVQNFFTHAFVHFNDNLKHSTVNRLIYAIKNGPFTIFGLFLFGLFLAKIRFFENTEQKNYLYKKVFYVSVSIFCLLYGIQTLILKPDSLFGVELSAYKRFLLSNILKSYGSEFFAAILVSGFMLLYSTRIRSFLDYLIPYGRMGLTNYISQSIFGLIFFTQPMLGFNNQDVMIRVIIATLFFAFQTFLCSYWLKYFAYGPIEWFWRSATYLKWIPFRKKSSINL